LYKTIFIEDSTAGLELKLDKYDLYTEYKVGQKVFIKCKGLYLGSYGGAVQLGYIYNGSIGRLPEPMIASHLYRDGFPGPKPVADTLSTSAAPATDVVGTLVCFKEVRFPDAGLPFVMTGEDYTNRNVADGNGKTISFNGKSLIVRTSSYANFKDVLLPTGKGMLTGVMSIYNGQYQLYVRDINDLQHFDTTTIIVKPNATIAGLKSLFTGTLMQISADSVIEGVVSANDESGNIYKTIYIQDNTGGIEVKLDKYDLFQDYPVGQKVAIKCKDLYLGEYGGVTQLGYIYNGSIGRIPEDLVSEHLFRNGTPGPAPVPDTLYLSAPATLPAKIGTLVAVKDVRFPDQGQTYVIPGETNTNRDIADAQGTVIKIDGKTFILRTSSYATFASATLPAGKGTLVGILSAYNGQYQMYIRNTNDCVNFDTTGGGTFLTTIYKNAFDASPLDWTIYSVTSNKDWAWDSQFTCMIANGYQGDVASEDWLISPAINLAGVSQTKLTFRTWTKYTDSGMPNPLEVFISTDYSGSGNPASATWTPLSCTLPAANSASWTSSGDVDLSGYHQTVYIGYKYRSSGTSSSTAAKWEVDSFEVTGYK
jgi:DNA/RNA endonuclease YhcR with UshA esterase domain